MSEDNFINLILDADNPQNISELKVDFGFPKYINNIIESQVIKLIDSIKKISVADEFKYLDVYSYLKQDLKILLVNAIRAEIEFMGNLKRQAKIDYVINLINYHFFNINIVIALISGDKDKLKSLRKFNKVKYSKMLFSKAEDLANEMQINFDDALLEVYKKTPRIPPALRDKDTLEFLKASNSFRKYRSRKNKAAKKTKKM